MRERVLLTVQSPYAEHDVVVRVSLHCHTVGCLEEAAKGSMQCLGAINDSVCLGYVASSLAVEMQRSMVGQPRQLAPSISELSTLG